ncbi:probable inactive receptor kinase At2g26730 [Salvia miltiorrhiza]|uniref:probable inactive receptor kinase At2g26730 n=1 Tax=Salvia miltiorrhiza TaxID=226208 RepID=UPI0025ACF445|nr:probable inactive receptor kinase At2g26730 [Salvia miltiorrhiza]
MKQTSIFACAVSLLLLLRLAESEENLVRDSLLDFFSKLSNNKSISAPGSGWNSTSDPCRDSWRGVTCDPLLHVQEIHLGGLGLRGVFDPGTLCNERSLSQSLSTINVAGNALRGENLPAIANCSDLAHLDLSSNQFATAQLGDSIPRLNNLQTLDLSSNMIPGSLPDLSQMHALTKFKAQQNDFSGAIPDLDFSRFGEFNVSHNSLSGSIPFGARGLPPSSFFDNPELCGPPLPRSCSQAAAEESTPDAAPLPPPPPRRAEKSGITNQQILMYIGYVVVAFVAVSLILIWLRRKGKKNEDAVEAAAGEDSVMKPSFSTVELKAGKGDYSSGQMSTSLIVLTSLEANGMRFEDLLKAPAELLGRGSHGSVYKVVCEEQGMTLAVKRIKDWQISSGEFRQRMRRLNQVKHPHVMPAVAYYTSGQEKLIVYEYQQNGSLFSHIHATGNGNRPALDWSSRLTVAATVADALAYMHEKLQYDRIPHGNLKSSNILLNGNMEASISEYGLMLVQVEGQEQRGGGGVLANGALEEAQEDYKAIFKADTYAFGVVLLELLTGRMVLTEGLDLGSWVVAVVREEWTVEVFDKNLMREGVNEERMVNLLQIAIRCVAKPPEARPSMRQVALAIGAIREEDERSLDVSDLSVTQSFVGL